MRAGTLTRSSLSRLAALPEKGGSVLSIYLDLDPARFPHVRDRRAQLDSLLHDAERRAGEGVDGQASVRSEIARVRELVSGEEGFSPSWARGLAIFCAGESGPLEVVRLPRAVEPAAVVAGRPFLEPLAGLGAPERWCVLLVSRRAARILVGTRDRLREVAGARDDVHRRHAQGGWSQARYQRGIEREVDDHIRASCALLLERYSRRPFEWLIVGGPSELGERVERGLHPDLRARLAGRLEIGVERTSEGEVRARALPVIERFERQREDAALAALSEGAAPGGRSAAGADEVLALLGERRVRTLMIAESLVIAGWACPRCGWLRVAPDPGVCPADGSAFERRADLVEDAIAAGLAQDADVLVFRHRPRDLAPHGGIAALLRY
jgi:peptide chain release factor subunit 1